MVGFGGGIAYIYIVVHIEEKSHAWIALHVLKSIQSYCSDEAHFPNELHIRRVEQLRDSLQVMAGLYSW